MNGQKSDQQVVEQAHEADNPLFARKLHHFARNFRAKSVLQLMRDVRWTKTDFKLELYIDDV